MSRETDPPLNHPSHAREEMYSNGSKAAPLQMPRSLWGYTVRNLKISCTKPTIWNKWSLMMRLPWCSITPLTVSFHSANLLRFIILWLETFNVIRNCHPNSVPDNPLSGFLWASTSSSILCSNVKHVFSFKTFKEEHQLQESVAPTEEREYKTQANNAPVQRRFAHYVPHHIKPTKWGVMTLIYLGQPEGGRGS